MVSSMADHMEDCDRVFEESYQIFYFQLSIIEMMLSSVANHMEDFVIVYLNNHIKYYQSTISYL